MDEQRTFGNLLAQDTPADFHVTIIGNAEPRTFSDVVNIFIDLIRLAVPVIFALAMLVFFWGLAKFIFRIGGDEKAVDEGKNLMKWGLIALFIMVSFWGIISFVYRDIGFGGEPSFPILPVNK